MKLDYILKNYKKEIPSYIIAEVAQAHDGSLGYAHSFIDLASSLGCNAVKFQAHSAVEESSRQDKFRKKFSYLKETRYQYWQRMEFSIDEWLELKKHAEILKMQFICSPFSFKAFNMMKKINLKIWKIASGELFNNDLLKSIANEAEIIIMSNGMTDLQETKKQIKLIKKINKNLILLHCNSIYPTPIKDTNLNQMIQMKNLIDLPVGFSDHSGNPYTSISAISLGAKVIEFHLCFNKHQFGPDTSSSLIPNDVSKIIEANKVIHKCKGSIKNYKNTNKSINQISKLFKKSVGVNKNLKKGHILTKNDLCIKKPGTGISPKNIDKCIGKKINRNINLDEILFLNDLKIK